jgi:cytochrome c553
VNSGHSRNVTACFVTVLLVLAAYAFGQQQSGMTPQLASQQPPPYWAFTGDLPTPKSKPTGNVPQHVPDSSQSFTLTQITDLFSVPDWHPDSHPPMPDIVAHGEKPNVFACGYCHLPNGLGRPENASLAGLSAEYITQQMSAFKSGARKSSEPSHLPVKNMVIVAQHAQDEMDSAAAKYFSALKPKPWIHVVETTQLAKTHPAAWMLVPDEPHVLEPIGNRIIEVPQNLKLTELRDDTSGFIAYVPKGSLKRGKLLVEKGGDGITMPCSGCHGPDMRGEKDVPSIAGRSPSYIVRQLYDLQMGSRTGGATDQMQIPVMKLTMNDMVAIAAYLASLKP